MKIIESSEPQTGELSKSSALEGPQVSEEKSMNTWSTVGQ